VELTKKRKTSQHILMCIYIWQF